MSFMRQQTPLKSTLSFRWFQQIWNGFAENRSA